MMKRCLIAAGIAVFAAWSAVAEQPQTVPLVIRDATVIDCSGRPPRSGMSILIIDGQIRAIAPSSRLRTPGNAQVLDAHGKYLIPGLWNMHVHLGAYADGKRALADYLAEGVTGVRDMGSPLEDILRLRKETAEGAIVGPDLVVGGPIVQGPLPFQMPVFIVSATRTASCRWRFVGSFLVHGTAQGRRSGAVAWSCIGPGSKRQECGCVLS